MKRIDYSKIQAGDVVLTGGNSIFSTVIRLLTVGLLKATDRNAPSHVGMVCEWGGQKFIVEMLSGGVSVNPFVRYMGESKRRWIVGVVSNSNLTPTKRAMLNRELAMWFVRRDKKNYDWNGVASFIVPRVLEASDKYFCSEMCAHLWRVLAAVPIAEKDSEITPADFLHDGVISGIIPVSWEK